VTVLVLGIVGALLICNRFLDADPARHDAATPAEDSLTLTRALASPSFWTFSIAISFLGLVLAGTSLFGESIMKERGLDASVLADYGLQRKVFVNAILIGIPFGLLANLLVGWLATRWPLPRLMALATALFGAALFAFPYLSTEAAIYAYAATLSVAGGGMTVCFYTVYRRGFGPVHLGAIQGAAQMLTVLFSGVGAFVFASTKARTGVYEPLFPIFAAIACGLALLTWAVGMPRRLPVITAPNQGNGENRDAFTRPDVRVR
jgi:MFS family permease